MDKSKWEYKKLGEVCTKASSNIVLNKIKDSDGDYPLYGANGFVKNIDFYHQPNEYIGIVKDGSGVGRVNTYPSKSSLVGTMQYILPTGEVTLSYLKYFLQSKNLGRYASGAAIPHIYFKDYSKELIPVLPTKEQNHIVSELDQLSAIISLKQQQMKEYDALAQSLFYEMFGDMDGSEKSFEKKIFGECFKLKSGDSLTAKNIVKGPYAVFGGNGIVGYHSEYNAEGQQIIIGRVGALCGNVHLIDGKNFITDNAFILSDSIGFDKVYLLYFLSMLNLRDYAREAMQPVISNKTLKGLTIPLPPISLQRSFAEKVKAIEHQKSLLKQSIAETQTLLDSRMQEYFG
jgi:type I restriction enzyme S subunit